MKKTLLAVALAAASISAYADVSLSGHVNYKIGDLEDFSGNEDITVNNANTSQSRFRIKGTKEANGITYGTEIEHGVVDAGVNRRVDEFFIQGGFGKISLGNNSEAGDGVTEADFSGTYLTQGDLSSWEFGGVFSNVASRDINRDERLKYDAPKLGPVSLSVSYANNDDINVAAFAGGSFWTARIATVAAEADDSDIIAGSVAFKFSGFTVAAAHWIQETGADNELEHSKAILGYNAGPISVSVDFQTTENDAETIDNETTGLNFVYRPTKGVELYAGLRSADDNVTDEDGNGFLAGARIQF
jgi:hypothetical protein